MVEHIIFFAWLFTHITGFCLASYGLLRESFKDLAAKRGFGEGRYGEGPYGGGSTTAQKSLISIGKRLQLLPTDETLTITNRKKNAAMAILGVLLIACSIILDLVARALVACNA